MNPVTGTKLCSMMVATVVLLVGMFSAGSAMAAKMEVDEFKKVIDNYSGEVAIVDLRCSPEYSRADFVHHVPNTLINENTDQAVAKIPTDKPVILFDSSNVRARLLHRSITRHGYENPYGFRYVDVSVGEMRGDGSIDYH